MEAVWQGVPVLTFPGDRWASRTSDSILAQTHLRDLVAPSEWRMMELAAEIGGDPATPRRLEQLRFEMRERLRTSAACDGQRLARGMEKLFREVLAAEAVPPSRG